jgi:hypothetical protein
VYLYQIYTWTTEGIWPSIPFSRFWSWLGGSDPAFSTDTLQHAAMWVMAAPTSLVSMAIGLGFVALSFSRH